MPFLPLPVPILYQIASFFFVTKTLDIMPKPKKKNFSKEVIDHVIGDLLDSSFMVAGERRLVQGAVVKISKKFAMSERNVRRIWSTAKSNRMKTGVYQADSKMNAVKGYLASLLM